MLEKIRQKNKQGILKRKSTKTAGSGLAKTRKEGKMNTETKPRSNIKYMISAILEIIVVLLPLYIGIYISAELGLNHIPLGGDVVMLGGYPQIIGFFITITLLFLFSKKRKGGWKSIGMSKPKNWLKTIFLGIVISGIVFVAVSFVINPLIRTLFPEQVRDMSVFNHLEGNIPNLLIQLFTVWVSAAFGEEIIFRGYMIERLIKDKTKLKPLKVIAVLLISSIIFGCAHLYQGPIGMIKTGAIGLVFGGCYFLSKRSLWPLIIAHGLIDTIDMITRFLG